MWEASGILDELMAHKMTDAESGRREILTPAPHTTGHTGP